MRIVVLVTSVKIMHFNQKRAGNCQHLTQTRDKMCEIRAEVSQKKSLCCVCFVCFIKWLEWLDNNNHKYKEIAVEVSLF